MDGFATCRLTPVFDWVALFVALACIPTYRHFGALSGLVMVYASMHEAVQARQWASRRLPPLTAAGSNRRRKQWVDMAVQDAQAALQDREDGMREWMGPPDDYESLRDAWQ